MFCLSEGMVSAGLLPLLPLIILMATSFRDARDVSFFEPILVVLNLCLSVSRTKKKMRVYRSTQS